MSLRDRNLSSAKWHLGVSNGLAGPLGLTGPLTLSHGLPHGLKIKKSPSLLGPHGFTAPAPWKAPPPQLNKPECCLSQRSAAGNSGQSRATSRQKRREWFISLRWANSCS